ncbi:MAG TPA: autotransporter outer membrane beta-barrel domain-containing protein [Burkholderiales bacterium]|nr:autotransporter outer membrane beta-barrel domain-containing protein [Burkholderiales bacterium]
MGVRGLTVWVLACALWAASAYAESPADQVKSMVEAGRMKDAYAYGLQHREAFGEPVFDFYFGIAAVDTGNAGEGVLALERYILRYPNNVSARLQLARGYFILGVDARAREEFQALRKLSPPPDVAATIDRYLDAIRLRETRYTLSKGLYVEAGIGTDSNVNGGVANANISLPILGPVTVAQTAAKQSDTFTLLGAGGYISDPVSPGVALYANGEASLKSNSEQSNRQYDLGSYNAGGGVSLLREKNLFRAGLSVSSLELGSSRFLSTTGAQVQWQHQLSELQALSLSAQTARLDYPGANSPRNADFWGLSGGYRRLFSYPWQPILSADLSAGHQRSLTDRPDLVPNTWGARVGVSFTPAAKWGVSADYTYQQSNYEGNDAILGVTREDRYEAVDAAVSYLYTRHLSLRGELTSARNHSNIELYSFPRDIVLFKARYEFN